METIVTLTFIKCLRLHFKAGHESFLHVPPVWSVVCKTHGVLKTFEALKAEAVGTTFEIIIDYKF